MSFLMWENRNKVPYYSKIVSIDNIYNLQIIDISGDLAIYI